MEKFNFEEYDRIKSKLLRWLKEKFLQIDWQEFPKEIVERKFDKISQELKEIWGNIEKEKIPQEWERKDIARLRGSLYEVLFYFSWMKFVCLERAWKILGGKEEGRWELLPLAGPILPIFYTKNKERIVPQIDADFLMFYIDIDEKRIEIHRPYLIDVKSPEAPLIEKRLEWQAGSAKYLECTMAIARAKNEFPTDIKEWEFKYICPNCGHLNENPKECEECKSLLSWVTFLEEK
jgi:hypothetical protein